MTGRPRGRPPGGGDNRTAFTLRLAPELLERVDAFARGRGSRTAVIAALISDGLAHRVECAFSRKEHED